MSFMMFHAPQWLQVEPSPTSSSSQSQRHGHWLMISPFEIPTLNRHRIQTDDFRHAESSRISWQGSALHIHTENPPTILWVVPPPSDASDKLITFIAKNPNPHYTFHDCILGGTTQTIPNNPGWRHALGDPIHVCTLRDFPCRVSLCWQTEDVPICYPKSNSLTEIHKVC